MKQSQTWNIQLRQNTFKRIFVYNSSKVSFNIGPKTIYSPSNNIEHTSPIENRPNPFSIVSDVRTLIFPDRDDARHNWWRMKRAILFVRPHFGLPVPLNPRGPQTRTKGLRRGISLRRRRATPKIFILRPLTVNQSRVMPLRTFAACYLRTSRMIRDFHVLRLCFAEKFLFYF